MAEQEVEAAWRAELERSGVKELRDALDGDGFTNELKRQAAFRWLGDEAEVHRASSPESPSPSTWRRMNVDGSPGCSRNSVATPVPWRASGKRLTSEKRIPGTSKTAPRPSIVT